MCKKLSKHLLNLGSKLELFVHFLIPKIGQTKLRIPNLNYLRKTTSTSASRLCVGHFALKMGFCCLINNGLVVAAKNVCHPFHNGAQKFMRSYLHLQFCNFMEYVQGCHKIMTTNPPLCSCCRSWRCPIWYSESLKEIWLIRRYRQLRRKWRNCRLAI